MRSPKRTSPKRPDVRSVKIQPRLRAGKYSEQEVPEIRLCGKWLQDQGCSAGAPVSIVSLPGLLIVKALE